MLGVLRAQTRAAESGWGTEPGRIRRPRCRDLNKWRFWSLRRLVSSLMNSIRVVTLPHGLLVSGQRSSVRGAAKLEQDT